jgi:hypothetical protein
MSIGFGIEKLGLFAVRFPRTVVAAIVLSLPLFLAAAAQLTFSSDIRDLFRSSENAFATLDALESHFPASAHDVQLVIGNGDLLSAEGIRVLHKLDAALKALDGVQGVTSIFSVPARPGADGASTGSMVTADLQEHAVKNPLLRGVLLSEGQDKALFLIRLKQEARTIGETRQAVAAVRTAVGDSLEGTGYSSGLTGLSVLKIEIIGALQRDQNIFRVSAFIVVLAASALLFRRFSYVVIATLPAAVAIAWLSGGMWLAGQDINVLTSVVPTIVLVIAFSDSVHLLFEVRRGVAKGLDVQAAVSRSVTRVGPACVLTSFTTVLALSSLALVDHPFIAQFGLSAAAGAVLALISVLLMVPALSVLMIREREGANHSAAEDPVLSALERVSAMCASISMANPRVLTATGLAIVAVGAVAALQNEPEYRYSDNLPQSSGASQAIQTIEDKFGGANTLRVLIDWPDDYDVGSFETLDVIRSVHDTVAKLPQVSGVTSLYSLASWLADGGSPGIALLRFAKTDTGEDVAARFISSEATEALVTAQLPDLPAHRVVDLINRLEAKLAEVETAHMGVSFRVTGVAVVTARASYKMINELNRSLFIAVTIVIGLLAVALSGVRYAVVSVLPNAVPILAGSLYLYLTGQGLQFTSLVAFTVGFGLAVDSTIHLLNRYRLNQETSRSPDEALFGALRDVGPVVIISTVVIAGGLATTLLSNMPMVRLYGTIAVMVLLISLLANLFLLPASIETYERIFGSRVSARSK